MFRFVTDGAVSRRTAYEFLKANEKIRPQIRKWRFFLRVMMAAVGILAAVYTVSSVMIPFIVSLSVGGGEAQVDPWLLTFEIAVMAVGLAVGICALVYAAAFDHMIAGREARLIEQNAGGAGEARFTDEQFEIVKPEMRFAYSYGAVQAIVMGSGAYFFFLSGSEEIVETRKMTEGVPSEFEAFLSEKTGKKIVTL